MSGNFKVKVILTFDIMTPKSILFVISQQEINWMLSTYEKIK